jgi:putative sporulation protein YtaF
MVAAASLFLLAFAVSLDSFSVGFTYGLRKMSMPFKSIVIIACCSAVTLLPHSLTGKLGGMILIAIGAWVLYQFFRPVKEMTQEESEKTLLNLEIKSFGIVINILSRPTAADIDKSGTITGVEALLLGFALSLDAFGAGIGAALLGYSPILTSLLVAVMSSLFVAFGIKSGHLFSRFAWMDKLTFLPGVLLIILGIWKL